MRNTFLNISLCILVLCFGCTRQDPLYSSTTQSVTIAGKVQNFDGNKNLITLNISHIGVPGDRLSSVLDDSGHFQFNFECYIPTDCWISYKTNFTLIIHPGDSIYVEFDGANNNSKKVLKSIVLNGDASKLNREAIIFQEMYLDIRTDPDLREKARNNLDYEQYTLFEDSLRQISHVIFNRYVDSLNSSEEIQKWVLPIIDQEFYDAIMMYPNYFWSNNNIRPYQWKIPISYWDPFTNGLPIEPSDLTSMNAMARFVNMYCFSYAFMNTWHENMKYLEENGLKANPPNSSDSINIYGILKHTPDTILRQMVLTEYFSQKLRKFQIEIFEDYQDLIQHNIKMPFLKEPLFEYYDEIKYKIDNPGLSSNAVLNNVSGTSIHEITDSIFKKNKGSVLLINCWGAYCSPCISQFPYAVKLMQTMKDKEIEFVYLCLNSDEKVSKAVINHHHLGGQHYFLNREQSRDLETVFDFRSIPHYILIDKKGTIIEQGSHLKPGNIETLNKINNLL
ncbi:MAG: thioredoxin family protein [Bacteroidales bacterium]|nr:thioredoxin family protein [Bacteroidales bacterium]